MSALWNLLARLAVRAATYALGHPDKVVELVKTIKEASKTGK